MKNIFLLLFVAFITNLGFAQAPPQGINYQAVVYSDNGENEPGLNVPGQVLRNKNIRVRFTIIQNATNGTQVYKESHTKTTDAFGMFSLVIGQGVQEGSNAFANINWGAGLHFLKVEIDKRGGTNYVTMSNQQLLSVPYALYSDKSTYATSAGNGISSVSDNGNGSLTFTYADGSTYTTPLLTGLQGPQGIQGATGAQGPAGQNGANGQNGTDGINGLNGANGQNGLSAYEIWLAQGNTGTEQDFLTAIIGAQGPQGIQGVDGQNGANGQNGVDGINGTNGVNGQNGLSAYEIWLAQGNSGTEQDFLTAITGATGAQGIQGLQGVAGATGAQGPIGLTGTTGATGPQGIQGVAGTNGTNGTNGADGKNTIAKTTIEAAGANCTTGGIKIEYGLDANNNGTLDVSEVNATLTKYICNGAVGATGAQGTQGATGPLGLTGATGPQGIQGAAGSNGTNGADGKNTIAKTTTESAGANCTTGGVKIEYGLDANNNGTLDVSEINAALTKYVCNGAVGSQGIQGPPGVGIPQTISQNGSIITLSDNGGSFSLNDADNNPNNEIQLLNISNDTLYLSNSNSVYLGSLISLNNHGMKNYTIPGNYSFMVPNNVNSIIVEIWGAGGSGGNGGLASDFRGSGGGGGGGSGGYRKLLLNVTPNSTHNVLVGSGGENSSGSNSSFDNYISNGGSRGGDGQNRLFNTNGISISGGTAGAGGNPNGSNGIAGTGTNGNGNSGGNGGKGGSISIISIGTAGNGGTGVSTIGQVGNNGTNADFGCGGGGGSGTVGYNGVLGGNGGNGGNGAVIISW